MGTATRQLQAFNHAFRRVCAQALAITVSEPTSHKPEGVETTGLTQLLNRYINTSTERSLMDYDSSTLVQDKYLANMSCTQIKAILQQADTTESLEDKRDTRFSVCTYQSWSVNSANPPPWFISISIPTLTPEYSALIGEPSLHFWNMNFLLVDLNMIHDSTNPLFPRPTTM